MKIEGKRRRRGGGGGVESEKRRNLIIVSPKYPVIIRFWVCKNSFSGASGEESPAYWRPLERVKRGRKLRNFERRQKNRKEKEKKMTFIRFATH